MKRILFLAAHRPGRSPGQRFRFEQYLGALKDAGFTCDVSFLLSEQDDQVFYKRGKYFKKFLIFLRTIRQRLHDLRHIRDYKVIFIYREAVMFGSAWFEKRIAARGGKIILDFDDAIWLHDVSEGNRNLAWLKRPAKTEKIIRLSKLVITGNEYLAAYARKFNLNTVVVPTTIHCGSFRRQVNNPTSGPICIGWTGSVTTLKHLDQARTLLKRLIAVHDVEIRIRVIADRPWEQSEIPYEFVRWTRETETEDLAVLDIGIMPLPDDDWARGKCGFKGLQYMALGIPTVMSPVGVNTEIIRDGENGFLASDEDEWFEKISKLITDPILRRQLGDAGRRTVEERYSFEAWKEKYVALFEEMAASQKTEDGR